MMRRQTRPPDLEFRRWFPFVALSFYTWKAGIYWSRVKISKDHIWEHDMENLGKTHYFLKIIPAPIFSDMQWFVMIAKRVLWPLFTIEDSTATANVKRVWRYLMRWEETRLYASRWRIHIPWITFDTARLEKYKKEHDESNCMLDAGSKFLPESSWPFTKAAGFSSKVEINHLYLYWDSLLPKLFSITLQQSRADINIICINENHFRSILIKQCDPILK